MTFQQLATQCHEIIGQYKDAKIGIAILDGKHTFYHQEKAIFRAASVMKIPILLTSYLTLSKALDTVAVLPEELIVEGAGVIPFLTGNLPFTYRNLMELMIIVSDNTASNALLEAISMEKVNQFMQDIGCEDSKIQRYFMDANAVLKGLDNVTTAKDMIMILQQIGEKNNFLNEKQQIDALRIMGNQQFQEMLPSYTFDEEIHYYHKTGGLTGVDHDVAIIQYHEKQLYAVVLSQGWEDGFTGKKCIAEIGKAIAEYIKS